MPVSGDALTLPDGSSARRSALPQQALTLLASAARTVQTASADQTNVGYRGVMLFVNVTVASGTGGLQARIQGKDPISGTYFNMNSAPTAVTATGMVVYAFYPAALSGGFTNQYNTVLPLTWRLNMNVGDSSSYTYSVAGVYLP